jgi:hypothetical protein
MHGAATPDNTPFAVEIELMREMRWSWVDLQDAPADLIDALIERLAAERHWQHEKMKMQKAMQR